MVAADAGDLDELIELWLETNEERRLVERLKQTSDGELEALSHYVSEPAANRLAESHPGVAAKLFRALAMRIVNAGKSRYYHEALKSFEAARRCYEKAGEGERWRMLVAEVRHSHSRKHGLMPGFERIARGRTI